MSDIYGKTGKKLIDLLLNGEELEETDTQECLYSLTKALPSDIIESLKGTLTKAQRFEMQVHFDIIDELMKIPEIKESCVEVILSKIGTDISAFQAYYQLAYWTEFYPGSCESRSVRNKAHIGRENNYLRTTLYHAGAYCYALK